MSYVQLDKASAASQALKLPHLFTLNPNSSGKARNFQKRQDSVIQNNLTEAASEKNLVSQILANNHSGIASQGLPNNFFILRLRSWYLYVFLLWQWNQIIFSMLRRINMWHLINPQNTFVLFKIDKWFHMHSTRGCVGHLFLVGCDLAHCV